MTMPGVTLALCADSQAKALDGGEQRGVLVLLRHLMHATHVQLTWREAQSSAPIFQSCCVYDARATVERALCLIRCLFIMSSHVHAA